LDKKKAAALAAAFPFQSCKIAFCSKDTGFAEETDEKAMPM
jgi:hypothetical protein